MWDWTYFSGSGLILTSRPPEYQRVPFLGCCVFNCLLFSAWHPHGWCLWVLASWMHRWHNTHQSGQASLGAFFAGVLCGIFALWCVGWPPAGNLVLGDKQNDCMSLLLTELWAWLMALTGAVSNWWWKRQVTHGLWNELLSALARGQGWRGRSAPCQTLPSQNIVRYCFVASQRFLRQKSAWRETKSLLFWVWFPR